MTAARLTFDAAPLRVYWEVTRACDLACRHCRAEALSRRHPQELTTGEGLHLLDLGTQYIPRRALIEDGGDEVLRCPTPGVLVRTADGWFLLDTGLNREVASRPDRIERWFAWGECEFPGAGDPLLEALSACGVAPGDLVGAAVSHLHADHSGGLRHLEDGPPVAVQTS